MKDSGIKKIEKTCKTSGKTTTMWQIRATAQVTTSTGKRVRKSRMSHAPLGTKRSKRLAIQAKLLQKAEDACQKGNPKKGRLVSLNEWAEQWAIEKIKADRWCKAREKQVLYVLEHRVLPVLGNHNAKTLDRASIQDWVFKACSWRWGKDNDKPYAKRTLQLWFGTLSSVVDDFAYHHKVRSPIWRIEWPKSLDDRPTRRRLAPESEVIDQILSAIPSLQIRRVLLLAFVTGCRISEVLKLDWQRVDLTKKVLQLGRKNTKTGSPHTVILRDAAVEVLRAQRQYQIDGGGLRRLCFVSPMTGGAFVRQTANKALIQACEDLESPRVTPHDLRRACATELINKGIPLPVVSAFIGHKSTGVTEKHYTLLSLEQIRAHIEPKPKEEESEVCK